jgi:phosphoribosyl 1,2-cyclic phosphate phosphodiesterase
MIFKGSMKIIFLGTGTSHGVPSLDCMIEEYANCPKDVCRLAQNDSKHARTRSSILIEWDGYSVLIDVSADFRMQALRERIRKIDAVLITHAHADHIGGIPDIRSYTRYNQLKMFGSEETLSNIKHSYEYIFNPDTFIGGGIPQVALQIVTKPFSLFGETITPVNVEHGNLAGCFGYRIGQIAYIPDMKSIDERNFALLKNIDTLIVNCLRCTNEHPTHLILPQSMELARRLSPRRCYFIHMCHDIHYMADKGKLEPWMEFSFDGLRFDI